MTSQPVSTRVGNVKNHPSLIEPARPSRTQERSVRRTLAKAVLTSGPTREVCMRLAALVVTLALGSILGNGTAKAFDCTGATLAASIVICSDPELMRLTDERQEAIKEARGRIGEEAWPDLWENQKAWVRSYATACGIQQDRPPPMPVPASIRACFKRAAEARIAFIRGYGLAPGTLAPVTQQIGPGFDCSKAVRPLALL